jgi:2,3-bisphosphoglycerate-independent phosphoglycerate mutase
MSSNRNTPLFPQQPVCLVIIDGWGLLPSSCSQQCSPIKEDQHKFLSLQDIAQQGNAIAHAQTPHMSELVYSGTYPSVSLTAHGTAVGLPEGLMGNSEVGHLNLGAGRVVYQDILRINMAFRDQSFINFPVVRDALERAKYIGRLHVLGLVSDGGIHSHIDHLFGTLNAAQAYGIPRVYIHFFSDGRDTSPTSGIDFVKQVQTYIEVHQYGTLATIIGRYYAMDRDKRWERIQIAYHALVMNRDEASIIHDPIKVR